jgi:hypothetical protein
MADAPLLIKFGEEDDSMELCDEGHELSLDAGVQKHGGNLVLEV